MKADQELAYSMIRTAALLGERCPINDVLPGGSASVGILCRAGLLKVEVSGHNWRVATLLTGADAGKTTKAAPLGWRVSKTITTETVASKPDPTQVRGTPSLRNFGGFADG